MSAPKTTGTTQYLSFMMGEVIFALEIGKVREILDFSAVRNVPRMPQFIRGLINLQGRVVPVVDLRSKFGLTRTENTANTCVIIVTVTAVDDTTVLGVLADVVLEVIDLGPDKLNPAPMDGKTDYHEFIQGARKQRDLLYSVLDLDKLFFADEIALVSAICKKVSPDTLGTSSCVSGQQESQGGTLADMDNMITVAKTFDDLLIVLDVMAKETYRITNTKQVRAEEIQIMASYLTEIRLLLNQQERYEASTKGSSSKMSSRYLELEGRVKEMRNDLDRAIKRVCR